MTRKRSRLELQASPGRIVDTLRSLSEPIRILTTVLSVALCVVVTRAQTLPDFSGTWRGDSRPIETLHRVDRGPVHWGPIPYTTTMRPYTVTIAQNSSRLEIAFPGGSSNFMNVGAYAFNGGQEVVSVRDFGEWWVKTVTKATSESDGRVILKATRLMDWWKSAKPDDVISQEAQTDTIFVLRVNGDRTQMVVDTTLSDEKGEVTYRQVFSRN